MDLRAFAAVPVDAPAILARLEELKRELAVRGLKWVAPHQLHFTLKFMAAVPQTELVAAMPALAATAASLPAFRLALEGVGTFPRGGPARVVWVGCGEGKERLCDLAARVEAAFTGAGLPAEERPFAAHLTLARVKDPREGRDAARAARAFDGFSVGTLEVKEVVLFRSVLGSDGAKHTPLARAKLSG